jgi:type I restriction enzyme S subunit
MPSCRALIQILLKACEDPSDLFRPAEVSIDSKFAFYCLSSGLTRFVKLSAGAAQKNLLLRDLRTYRFALPKSLAEQWVVAAQLAGLSEQTQRLESIYQRKDAALEALKKSLCTEPSAAN